MEPRRRDRLAGRAGQAASQVVAAARARIAVDVRALAVLRAALGVLLLADLGMRGRDLVAFTTDEGILPREELARMEPWLHRASLHALGGSAAFEALLFAVAALAALALLSGWRTRAANAVSLVLLASLLLRNPLVLNAGDSLLLMLLFWGLFLPLGARWSLDARGRGCRGTVATAAAAGLLAQVLLMYAVNAVFKLRSEAWRSGEALAFIFGSERHAALLGPALAHAPGLVALLGWAWLAMLAGCAVLVATTGRARTVAVAAYMGVHVAMLLTLRLGLFPLVSLASLLPFLPPPVWDRIEARIGPWARRLAGRLPPPSAVAPPLPARPRRLGSAFPAVALAGLIVWSGASLGATSLPDALEPLAERHARGWALFARPHEMQIWHVVPATTASGAEVDALTGGPVVWDGAKDVSPYPDIRWRTYLQKIGADDVPVEAFAAYLCHRWDTTHEDPLLNLTIHRLERPIDPRGPDPPARSAAVLGHRCGHSGSR